MRRAVLLLLLPLTLIPVFAAAADVNPFAPDGEAVEPVAPPVGPPRSKADRERAIAYLDQFPHGTDAARVALDVYVAAKVGDESSVCEDMWRRLAFDHPRSLQNLYLITAHQPEAYRKILVDAAFDRGFDRDFAERYLAAVLVGLERTQGKLLADDTFYLQIALAVAEIDGFESLGRADAPTEGPISHQGEPREDPLDFTVPATALQRSPDQEKERQAKWDASCNEARAREQAVRRQLLAACRTKLREGDQSRSAARVAAVLFDGDTGRVAKLLALHSIQDDKSAQICEDELYDSLAADQKAALEMVEARAERLLEQGKFAEASPVIDELVARDRDAKHLFWKGWCRATQGDAVAATEAFEAVGREFPEDPWRPVADAAAAAVRDSDARLSANAEAIAGSVRQFMVMWPSAVEMHAAGTTEAGRAVSVYAFGAFDREGGLSAEALVSLDGKVVLAARSNGDGSRLFMTGDPVIHTFPDRLPIPTSFPRLNVSFDETTNEYRFHASGAISSSAVPGRGASPLSEWVAGVVTQLHIATADGARTHLDGFVRRGGLPGPVDSDAEGRKFTWFSFSPRIPEVRRVEFHFATDGRFDRASAESAYTLRVRYGDAAEVIPNPPAWPEASVVAHETWDSALLIQLVAAASKFWTEENRPASATADADPNSPR